MFNQEHLSQIDKQYFNVIMLDGLSNEVAGTPVIIGICIIQSIRRMNRWFCFISIDFSIHIISMEEQIH